MSIVYYKFFGGGREMKNFCTVILTGVDVDEIEEELDRWGYQRLPEYDISYTVYGDGTCERKQSFRSVYSESLFGGRLRIYIRDPGELCVRIEGPRDEIGQFLVTVCAIPPEQFEELAK